MLIYSKYIAVIFPLLWWEFDGANITADEYLSFVTQTVHFTPSTEGTKQAGPQYVNNFSSSATHSGQKRCIATIRPLILKGLLKNTMVSVGYLEANE